MSDNKLGKEVAALLIRSLGENLDINGACEDVRPLLVEAQEVIWMTCTTSEWSLLNESAFFPCCGRMAKFLPSGLMFEICHPGVARSTNRALT